MSNDTQKEITNTRNWAIGILLTLGIQTLGFVWYLAQNDALLKQHTQDIEALKSGSSVFISRDQLDDLLGARDEKTANIEKSLIRIESKLDKIIP